LEAIVVINHATSESIPFSFALHEIRIYVKPRTKIFSNLLIQSQVLLARGIKFQFCRKTILLDVY